MSNLPQGKWSGYHRAAEGGGYPATLDSKPACDLNTYFSVSSVRPNAKGGFQRKKEYFGRMLALVVDDADISTLSGEVSYVIETSPGKRQAGIFLDGVDPDCSDVGLCSSLVTEMTRRGMMVADKFGNSVARYVRLPVGQNQKPRDSGNFTHLLSLWQPEVRLTLAAASAVVGIELEEIRTRREQVREAAAASGVSDYQVQRESGAIKSQSEKLPALIKTIIGGDDGLHDSIRDVASSLVATGMACGSVVNLLRALMDSGQAPMDARLKARYDEIPSAVKSAEERFKKTRIDAAVEASTVKAKQPGLAEAPAKKRKYLTLASDLVANLSAPTWTIKGLLEADSMSVMYGASGDGKSFLAFDMACCVATGSRWHGRKVRQGPVVYVVGEGKGGVSRRLAAWEKYNGKSLTGAPLHIVLRPIDMIDREAALGAVEAICEELPLGQVPVLVVIDTVARAFVGGDENSTKDMGEFVNTVDTLLKDRWAAHVLLVHHTGKDASKGARGSVSLRCALDQEFAVEKTIGSTRLIVKKMKDGPSPDDLCFKMNLVPIMTAVDDMGDTVEINSLAPSLLEGVNKPIADTRAPGRRSGGEDVSVAGLIDLMSEVGWPGVQGVAEYMGCGKKRAMDLIRAAEGLDMIAAEGEGRHRRYVVTARARSGG